MYFNHEQCYCFLKNSMVQISIFSSRGLLAKSKSMSRLSVVKNFSYSVKQVIDCVFATCLIFKAKPLLVCMLVFVN